MGACSQRESFLQLVSEQPRNLVGLILFDYQPPDEPVVLRDIDIGERELRTNVPALEFAEILRVHEPVEAEFLERAVREQRTSLFTVLFEIADLTGLLSQQLVRRESPLRRRNFTEFYLCRSGESGTSHEPNDGKAYDRAHGRNLRRSLLPRNSAGLHRRHTNI